jgi:hypothetical protein
MSSTAAAERPRPHPSVETAFLAPEAVLYDMRHHQVHHLNPSASAVWLLIDGVASADDIATELSEIFSAPYDVVRPDVTSAIEDFRGRGLLDAVDDASAPDPGVDHRHDAHRHEASGGHHAEIGVIPLPRPPDP